VRQFIDIVDRSLLEAPAPRLSFADAKEFLSDIEHSHGRILDLVTRRPWLKQFCQDAARQNLGSEISVFRGFVAYEPLRGDEIASTSTNWKVAFTLMTNGPGIIFHGNKTISTTKHLLHYRIKPENVVCWIPAAMEFVRQAVGTKTNVGIEDRWGERTKIAEIYEFLEKEPEDEIIADLRGLRPKILNAKKLNQFGWVDTLYILKKLSTDGLPQDPDEWCDEAHVKYKGKETDKWIRELYDWLQP
jgi:hypothetical protein